MLADQDIEISRMLPDLAAAINASVVVNCGAVIPFMFVLFSGERGHYIATEERARCLAELRILLDHFENGRPKVGWDQLSGSTKQLQLVAHPIAQNLNDGLKSIFGQHMLFTLVFFTDIRPTYISTADRVGSVDQIKSLMAMWDAGGPDVPDHLRH